MLMQYDQDAVIWIWIESCHEKTCSGGLQSAYLLYRLWKQKQDMQQSVSLEQIYTLSIKDVFTRFFMQNLQLAKR